MVVNVGPKTLQQAIIYFANYEHCRQAVEAIRWPSGKVTCPRCGSDKVAYLDKARVYKCYGNHPKAKFSLKVGTVFEDSPIGFEKWLPALWLIVNCKNGISSYELGRALDVTQKTAWFMLARLRLAIQDRHTGGKIHGHVEADETFIGGRGRFMSKSKRARIFKGRRGPFGKVAVMGLLNRHDPEVGHSTVRTSVIGSTKRRVIQARVREHLAPGSNLYTDALPSYEGLASEYVHQVIDHAESYAMGNVHTNGMENFWSLLKRAIKGTYVSVEPFHLFRYLDEQCYRFNKRQGTDQSRFFESLKGILGRRITYRALTGSELPQTC